MHFKLYTHLIIVFYSTTVLDLLIISPGTSHNINALKIHKLPTNPSKMKKIMDYDHCEHFKIK